MNLINILRRIKAVLKEETNYRKQSFYKKQLATFKSMLKEPANVIAYGCRYEDTESTPVEPHYTYHPAWAARVLAQTKPDKHMDISSTTHFSNIVSAFIPTEFYDYRPAPIVLSNYTSGKADLTNLHFASNSVKSLSCMHTVEHIGLGRYGDPIDAEGDKKAMKELARILAVGGNLLFVVPIGHEQVAFNYHRIYSYQTIVENFAGLTLHEFSLIPDDFEKTGYITNPPMDLVNNQHWGCGCFWFTKK